MSSSRGCRILVVDDEAPLLQLIEKYLARLEYSVTGHRTGQEAWEEFSAEPGRYPLVIVDLNLPDLPGEELARRILAAGDRTRILVCSGYPFEVSSLGPGAERAAFLQKPFVPKMLADAIEEILSRAA